MCSSAWVDVHRAAALRVASLAASRWTKSVDRAPNREKRKRLPAQSTKRRLRPDGGRVTSCVRGYRAVSDVPHRAVH